MSLAFRCAASILSLTIATAVVQAGLIVWAMLIVRRTRLLPVMLIPFSLGTLLTLLQVIAGSDSLALLAPWRVSAFLMPLATVILFARLLAALLGIFARPGGARAAVWLDYAMKAALTVFGCDPKLFTYSQPVRVPGAWRDGKLQRLIWLRD